jgi:hypothetical protein
LASPRKGDAQPLVEELVGFLARGRRLVQALVAAAGADGEEHRRRLETRGCFV